MYKISFLQGWSTFTGNVQTQKASSMYYPHPGDLSPIWSMCNLMICVILRVMTLFSGLLKQGHTVWLMSSTLHSSAEQTSERLWFSGLSAAQQVSLKSALSLPYDLHILLLTGEGPFFGKSHQCQRALSCSLTNSLNTVEKKKRRARWNEPQGLIWLRTRPEFMQTFCTVQSRC